MNKEKSVREPLFHVAKRTEVTVRRQILARVIATLIGIIVTCLICLDRKSVV